MSWNLCGCGCRRAETFGPGCPCPECQPGPGINHLGRHNLRSRQRTLRMTELLKRDDLSPEEAAELDDLLHVYLYQ